MARACQCCAHPRVKDLNRDLVRGDAQRAVARKYGLTPDAVHRHDHNHLTEEMRREIAVELKRERAQAVATELNEERIEVDSGLQRIVHEIDALLRRAKADGNDPLALMSLKEMRATLMSLAQLHGSLRQELTVTVNLNESPQFLTLRELILRVLERHPAAKADFLGEMKRLAITHG
jgi:hypothetical protein